MPKGPKPRPLAERFWERVQKTETCWLWLGARASHGYGNISEPPRKIHLVHRLSWRMHEGPIPRGLCVLHRCDTPNCVNPKHLFLGTRKDNTQDMFAKGRAGAQLYPEVYAAIARQNAKLLPAQVEIIRNSKEMTHKLAKQYGVGSSSITNIRSGRTWKAAA